MTNKRTSSQRWSHISPEQKGAMRSAFADFLHGPMVQGFPGAGSFEEAPEPPPPAEVRKLSMERMREIGRALMVAGARPPRQQMVEIGRAMEELLDQLGVLADQPGRAALRRRILLGLRQRVTSAM